MSTEDQQYSLNNQESAIRQYTYIKSKDRRSTIAGRVAVSDAVGNCPFRAGTSKAGNQRKRASNVLPWNIRTEFTSDASCTAIPVSC
jgi:hypothetical protein